MTKQFPLPRFINQLIEAGQIGGFILLVSVIVSLSIANSPWQHQFNDFLHLEIGFSFISLGLLHWINDGLMFFFFLLVGLEIKREFVSGELSSLKKASMPVIAALGGIVMPAIFYMVANLGSDTAHGWGIPTATDIAFALAVVLMLGEKVPYGLKIFLLALAIVDDLGAIVIIALFYSSNIHLGYLLASAGLIFILLILNISKVRSLLVYLACGILLWYLILHSGIHATIAGVILAFAIPLKEHKGFSPLTQLEHWINKPVNYLIMPLFALVNTNIKFGTHLFEPIFNPIGLGILLGLIVGKPLGISLFAWLTTKLNLGELPKNTSWKQLIGLSTLGGIGFTMSIFVSMLSFDDVFSQEQAKAYILIGSVVAGIIGYTALSSISKKKEA